jgi:putative ABC transport system substrate-binding protein
MTVVGDQVSGVRFQHEPRPTARQKTLVGIAVGALLFALGLPADAQQQAKIPKIGALRAQPASSPASSHELFLRTFRELGYVEGKNIAFETRSAEGKLDRFSALADELVRLKVDVLVASSTSAALAAKNAASTIPIVFLKVSDPVASGLVDSLARPGGNITGITSIDSMLAGKRLELLKKPFPSSPLLRCCGIQGMQTVNNSGKKANYRRANWACNCIPWK